MFLWVYPKLFTSLRDNFPLLRNGFIERMKHFPSKPTTNTMISNMLCYWRQETPLFEARTLCTSRSESIVTTNQSSCVCYQSWRPVEILCDNFNYSSPSIAFRVARLELLTNCFVAEVNFDPKYSLCYRKRFASVHSSSPKIRFKRYGIRDRRWSWSFNV